MKVGEKWWVGKKVECENGLPGELCGTELVLTEQMQPIYSFYYQGHVYKVRCPECKGWMYISREI